MRLHARHGWAYDAGIWNPLAGRLGPIAVDDRGYYGPPRSDALDESEPYLLIGHSLGAWRMLGEAGPSCIGLVAINGFDRFVGGGDFPGIAARVVDRMQRRCVTNPDEVAADFRARCGDTSPLLGAATARLGQDLGMLSDLSRTHRPVLPLLSLEGAADPLLLPAHRSACFIGAEHVEQSDAGHLLPLTHPDWCAEAITRFMSTL